MNANLTQIQETLNAFLFGDSWAPVALLAAITAVVLLSNTTRLGKL